MLEPIEGRVHSGQVAYLEQPINVIPDAFLWTVGGSSST